MEGVKIMLVIETLLYLVGLLNENDRISLVLFEESVEILCGLERLTT
jgi:hypothetical protein